MTGQDPGQGAMYQCPECSGQFPEFAKWQGEFVCPWCYNPFLRHHSSPAVELNRMREGQA